MAYTYNVLGEHQKEEILRPRTAHCEGVRRCLSRSLSLRRNWPELQR